MLLKGAIFQQGGMRRCFCVEWGAGVFLVGTGTGVGKSGFDGRGCAGTGRTLPLSISLLGWGRVKEGRREEAPKFLASVFTAGT